MEELDRLVGSGDHLAFLNSKNELFRERRMKENPPSRSEALELMAAHPNLIRRPLLAAGGKVLAGFNPDEWSKLK